MAGMLVFGEGQAARSLALAGTGMKLPVLWAKGGIAKIHGIGREVIDVFFSRLFQYPLDPNKTINLKSTFGTPISVGMETQSLPDKMFSNHIKLTT